MPVQIPSYKLKVGYIHIYFDLIHQHSCYFHKSVAPLEQQSCDLPKNFTFLHRWIIIFSLSSFALSLMVSFNTSSILSCMTRTVAGRSDYDNNNNINKMFINEISVLQNKSSAPQTTIMKRIIIYCLGGISPSRVKRHVKRVNSITVKPYFMLNTDNSLLPTVCFVPRERKPLYLL